MRVILRENVPNVGKIGDVLTVADGFGRNYLLPRNLAVLANERSEAQFEHNKRVAASRLAKAKEEAKGVAKALDGLRLTVSRHAGEDGRLFGSVTVREVADMLAEQGYNVDRRDITMPDSIKALGEYPVTVKLHSDVQAKVTLEVKAADAA
jgi:large subunit ribosomal protein L9